MKTKEEQVTEGNKLIAKFMGKDYRIEFGNVYIKTTTTHSPLAKYDSSWDWLMPVIERIESLGFTCFINGNECSFESLGKTIGDFSAPSKIEAAYMAAIKFIRWHNQNV